MLSLPLLLNGMVTMENTKSLHPKLKLKWKEFMFFTLKDVQRINSIIPCSVI